MGIFETLEWQVQARCKGLDAVYPGLFMPELLEDGRRIVSPAMKESIAQAKAVCRQCPVRSECDTYAERVHAVGVWGGKLRVTIRSHRVRHYSPQTLK